MEKTYLSSQDLLDDSFKLAAQVVKSGFKPKVIIALWRGGAPIGIAVQEFLDYFGIKTDHIAIRTSSYSASHERSDDIKVHGLNYLIKNINSDDSLLIVDDVFDTGITIQTVIEQLRDKARANCPKEIRVAVPWFKPTHNRTERSPDYYIHTTDKWLKYPFSLEGLSIDEVRENRPEIFKIIEPVLTQD
ncbi:MAG: hypoxanthine phosphoribosyltransferase [Gammaproteobacteria bacterium]|nr:hypoxanthine phosphoribosyltransferase [Gammaproteobacteria bacterium]